MHVFEFSKNIQKRLADRENLTGVHELANMFGQVKDKCIRSQQRTAAILSDDCRSVKPTTVYKEKRKRGKQTSVKTKIYIIFTLVSARIEGCKQKMMLIKKSILKMKPVNLFPPAPCLNELISI